MFFRERKQSRESALKVLDYATNGAEGKSNCAKFIDILGESLRLVNDGNWFALDYWSHGSDCFKPKMVYNFTESIK